MKFKQNEKRILEMKQPPITSYPVHANTLSTTMLYEDSLKWFYDFYIQLFANKDTSEFCYVDFYSPIPWKSCPWIYYQRLSAELVSKKWNSITDFLIDSIDLNCYIFLYLNQFFIPSAPYRYNKQDFMHDTYVFGYDLKERVFYTADFYNINYKYCTSKLEFSLLEKAYDSVDLSKEDDFLQGILLISPVNFTGYNVNTNLIVTFINDFLTSNTSPKGHSGGYRYDIETKKDNFSFGMGVFKVLTNYLEQIIQGNSVRDHRGFHVLYDHTVMMLMRLKYLTQNSCLKNSLTLINHFEIILEKTHILEYLILKAFITNDLELVKRSINILNEVAKLEKDGLHMILDNIQ